MSVLLHLSDPHFGTERAEVVEALTSMARALQPRLVVLSGDLTQRARRAQFAAARRFVDRLGAPHVLVIPGNHDIPLLNVAARLAAPYAGYLRAFGPELAPEFEAADLLVIGVNTTRWWRHKHGEISVQQVQAVASRLVRARARQMRVVVTHQPVHVDRQSEMHNLVRGHARALAAWNRAGVHIVLGGHIHLAHVERAGEVWSVLAGTAVSSRVRAGKGNSVNVLRHEGDECAIERWDHVPGRGFTCAQVIRVTLRAPPVGAARG